MNKGSEIKKPEKKLPIIPPCKICGEPASGFHYGLNSCGACKAFYLRSLARTEPYACLGDGHCKIGPEVSRRKSCQKCRFDKCLRLGMSKTAIKIGRYTYSKRTQDILELKQITEAGGIVPGAESLLDASDPNRVTKQTPRKPKERLDEKEYDKLALESDSRHTCPRQRRDDSHTASDKSRTEWKSDSSSFTYDSGSLKADSSIASETSNMSGNFPDSSRQSTGFEYHPDSHDRPSGYIPMDEKRFSSSESSLMYMETEQSCDSTIMDQTSASELHPSLYYSYSYFNLNDTFTEAQQRRRGADSRWENSMLKITPEFAQPFLFCPRSPDMRTSVLQSQRSWMNELSQSLVKDNLSYAQAHFAREHASDAARIVAEDGRLEDNEVFSSHTADISSPDTQATNVNSNITTTSIISKSMHTLHGDLSELAPAEAVVDHYKITTINTNNWNQPQSFDNRKLDNDSSQPMEDQNCGESAEIIDLSKQIVDLQTKATMTAEDDSRSSIGEVTTTMKDSPGASVPSSSDELATEGSEGSALSYRQEEITDPKPTMFTGLSPNQASDFRQCQIWSSEFTDIELGEWTKTLVSYHFNHVIDNNCDDAQLRERTNTIYNEYRLQENTFGELKALDRELYFEVYKSTGLDVDGRGKLTTNFLRGIQNEISTMINFFKQIPGFRNLPINDQSVLVKGCAHEYQLLGLYRGWNDKTKLTTFIPLGATLSEQDMRKIFPDDAYFSHISMAETLQRLALTFEQVVILKAIVATTPDREKLESKETVSDIHWKLINCLLLVLWQQEQHPLHKFSQIMSVLTEMRNYSVDIRKSYMNIKADIEELTGKDDIPLVFELLF